MALARGREHTTGCGDHPRGPWDRLYHQASPTIHHHGVTRTLVVSRALLASGPPGNQRGSPGVAVHHSAERDPAEVPGGWERGARMQPCCRDLTRLLPRDGPVDLGAHVLAVGAGSLDPRGPRPLTWDAFSPGAPRALLMGVRASGEPAGCRSLPFCPLLLTLLGQGSAHEGHTGQPSLL